jgi:two-component system cell cycle sensor histidine kinase/response regulator CckA
MAMDFSMSDKKQPPPTLSDRIAKIFSFPVFADRNKTRTAKILVVVLWTIMVLGCCLILAWQITGKSQELGPHAYLATAGIILWSAFLLILTHRGRVKSAGLLFTLFFWSNITFQAFTSDGIRGSAAILFMTTMLLASLLIGWRASLGLALLNIGVVWMLAHAEAVQLIEFQIDSPYEVALETTVIFTFAAVLLMLTTTGLFNALKRARKSERSLKKTNQMLQDNLEKLAKREKDLQRSEKNYRELVQSANSIIIRMDLKGELLFVNHFALNFFGFEKDELIGKNILGTLIPDLKPSRQMITSLLHNIIDQPEKYAFHENENIRSNGEKVWIAWANKLIRHEEDNAVELLSIGNDTTHQKHLEAQLRQAQKMEAVGTLTGGIAHDFNNILTTIMGHGELGRQMTETGRDNSEHLDQVVLAAERARDLVKQLMTFSRRSGVNLQPIDLNQVLHHSLKLLQHTIPKMINIQTHLSDSLLPIKADATQLEQVIINLVSNASHAMPEGGDLSFTTQMVQYNDRIDGNLELKSGSYALLGVTDTGHGMNRNTLEQIFDPFFTTKEIGMGTGLGLSTVYGIVKGHGGHITCYSEPGRGTVFNIYLPAVRQEDILPTVEKSSQSSAQGAGEVILLVDDEQSIRKLSADILKHSGYQTIAASCGEEALEIFNEDRDQIDLVILDLGMPGMGGHKCMKELLKLKPDLKVLIASGYSSQARIKSTLDDGAAGFIAKPYRSRELCDKVHALLSAADDAAS